MSSRFSYTLGGLLPHRLSTPVKELYLSAILQNLALAMLLIWEPIYLWQHGYGLREILWFFGGVYVAYFFLMPWGANFATKHGYEHSMFVSSFWQIAYYASLFWSAQSWQWLIVAVFFYALQKSFYWPAYHADFARYSSAAEEGKQIGGLSGALSLVYIIGPLLAGAILTLGSWAVLFVVGSVVIFLSNWSLLRTREQFTPHYFSYAETYKQLVNPERRRDVVSFLGFGEELVALVIWPIFIATVVSKYFDIGIVVASATLITTVVTLYIGKITDQRNKRSVLRFVNSLYILGWLGRWLAVTPVGVFAVDTWSRLTKGLLMIPLTAIVYERAKNSQVMHTVVFFEMSLVLGKLLAIIIILILFNWVSSWSVIWLAAGFMSLLYLIL